jgi:membrane protein YdbS with pleckstrin-like domain
MPMKLPVELQPGETVVLRLRRHPVFLALKVGWPVLLALVPAGLLLWLGNITVGLSGVGGTIVWAIAALWALFWLVRAYFEWYRYEHDEWIVTTQRLLDAFSKNWFSHELASADLVNVQDISIHKSGPLASIFNFGNVECQTAGQNATFVLSAIPDPTRVLSIIDQTRDTARVELQSGGRHQQRPPDLSEPATPHGRLPDAVPGPGDTRPDA